MNNYTTNNNTNEPRRAPRAPASPTLVARPPAHISGCSLQGGVQSEGGAVDGGNIIFEKRQPIT